MTRRCRHVQPPVNYTVESDGRTYRVVATSAGRVLMVMRKTERSETPLLDGAPRFQQVVLLACQQHAVTLHHPSCKEIAA